MRVRLGVLPGALAALCLASPAVAATFAPCKVPAKGRTCGQLTVPLDRTGAVPGTVKLRIERSRARTPARPPLLIVAGRPGDSTTATYNDELTRRIIGTEVRSRDVVVMDLRGTGRSSVLRCQGLEEAPWGDRAEAAAACARELGARRGLYAARDSAQDVEAVRVALGSPRIALLGQSYGSRVALEYARRYPANVERMVLAAPVAPAGLDPLERSTFAALPRLLRHICPPGACRGSTRDLAADTARLAQRLASEPLQTTTVDDRGRHQPITVTARDLYALIAANHTWGLSATSELPGLVRNALRGDTAPLARAVVRSGLYDGLSYGARWSSPAAAAAAVCEESTFPWSRTAPVADRDGQARALVAALPPTTFAPFGGEAALQGDTLELCRLWTAASEPAEPPVSLPAIPTLVVAAESDLHATAEDAEAVARLVPGARVLRDWSGFAGLPSFVADDCSRRGLRRFLAGGLPNACPRRPSLLPVANPSPMSLREVAPAGGRGRAGRTFAAVRATLADGVSGVGTEFIQRLARAFGEDRDRAAARRILGQPVRAGGLRSGSLKVWIKTGDMRLVRLSYVPGVRVSGRLEGFFTGASGKSRGVLRISGTRAARGRLVLRGEALRGRLGGRAVRGKVHAPYAAAFDDGSGVFFMRSAVTAATAGWLRR